MVAQLESAPADVGFVYPNPQHFGNRNDYVQSPAYNLHLLLQDNYCPATSLFDRRVFDAGVAYDEEIVFGHEDWDIVLQLAERGVSGEVAHGPTFKYRRRGFSRVNAVEYGPESFHDEIERRHPALFAPAARARIKARWAPALSVVLLDDHGGGRWSADAVEPLGRRAASTSRSSRPRRSTCPASMRRCTFPATAGRLAGPTRCPRRAGRWVLVATLAAAPAFARSLVRRAAAARVLGDRRASGVALADVPEQRLAAFSQLAAHRRRRTVAVAWERSPAGRDGAGRGARRRPTRSSRTW